MNVNNYIEYVFVSKIFFKVVIKVLVVKYIFFFCFQVMEGLFIDKVGGLKLIINRILLAIMN